VAQHVIESPYGPMLVYEWVPGELLGVERSRRADPASPFQRFRALPFSDLLTGLDVVFDFHRSAAELGWVAVDFYDGAMIYDFATQTMRLIDLDHYRDRPFTNEMGRMFGSTRFMAPEEIDFGTIIDEVTPVFTMGRVISVFLSDGARECYKLRSRAGLGGSFTARGSNGRIEKKSSAFVEQRQGQRLGIAHVAPTIGC
jgi:serine/threonine-protein kinase